MALIGNYSVLNKVGGRTIGGSTVSDTRPNFGQTGATRNRFFGGFAESIATPVGYNPGVAWVPAYDAGGMSMRVLGTGTLAANLYPAMRMQLAITGVGTMSLDISGRKLMGLSVTGSGSLAATLQAYGNMALAAQGAGDLDAAIAGGVAMAAALSGSGDLSGAASLVAAMVLALSGSGTLSAGISGRLAMAADIFGSGDLDASAQGRWNMALAATGSGDLDAGVASLGNMVMALTGTGDLDAAIGAIGNMSIDLVVTGTGLTTSNVGAAVWAALASANNVPGSMGEKLNDAGSASNPWTEDLPGSYIEGQAGYILAAIQTLTDELHRLQGLKSGEPMTVTPTSRVVGDITQAISGNGTTSTTVTRT